MPEHNLVVPPLQRLQKFWLYRDVDTTGVSGSGIVAEGVIFSDGSVCMKWMGENSSIVIHPSLENVRIIHGHGGLTKILLDEVLVIPEGGD